ncbi:MAG: ATP-grasp domain-containing protein [Candidatus Aminicenantes bacterium]|nr:ATP-grasp domain-containing protein [Candidatus Aminicenantes bacterium]
MKEKVMIPNRGVVALDIIDSLKSIGLETILLYSPEDSRSLPVKLADRSFKFYSSKLDDSYLDREAIIEKALELNVHAIHPGYGFLAEDPIFSRMCEQNHINFIGPDHRILETVHDKIHLRQIANELGLPFVKHSELIKSQLDFELAVQGFRFPLVIKPLKGLGGRGIKTVIDRRDARQQINEMLKRDENQKNGIFLEPFFPHGHHIEIPFFRDGEGNILFLPEIESSIQRRFQKIFEESPSPNLSALTRDSLYHYSKKLIERINYLGLGYVEFLVSENNPYFFEMNPTFQINTLIPEIHIISNFIKKQYAISNGEVLHSVKGTKIINPKYHILLVSLMAENPSDNFQPSSGTITEFYHYSTIRNIFKSSLYTGARISPLYDPYIGKIITFSSTRNQSIGNMKNFIENINIRGINTNLHFLKSLLDSDPLIRGETIIDFLNRKWEYANRKKTNNEILTAALLLSSAFHIENRKKNYKEELQKMKQPGFFKRLFRRF